jgi:hypothetical protein
MLLDELLHENQLDGTDKNVIFTEVPPEKRLVFVGE